MKSLIILLVDNGESLDQLDTAIDAASNATDVIDWTVRVDIPESDVDYSFWVHPSGPGVYGLPSRDHTHVTFPGD